MNLDIKHLKKIQQNLRKKIILKHFTLKKKHIIAGIDCAFKGDKTICAIVLMNAELNILEEKTAEEKTSFPYVPGFLSFREGAAIEKCYATLKTEPDLLIFDGQGIAHPGGLGLASHMGIVLGKPSIGAAKSRLVGKHKEPGVKRGNYSFLFHKGKKVGAVLRTREKTKPMFISPGHKTDIRSSMEIILKLSKFRICEPTRQAHMLCSKVKALKK